MKQWFKGLSKGKQYAVVLGAIFVALVVISAAAGGGSTDEKTSTDAAAQSTQGVTTTTSTTTETSKTAPEARKQDADCGIKATGDCTPRVGPTRSIRVDALYWRIVSASTAKTVGDTTYGLGEKANGTFVLVKVRVRSDRDSTATLTSDVAKLEAADGTTYDPNTTAMISANESGKSLVFEDIGPDSTITSILVYDLPTSKTRRTLRLRVGELGLGDGHGYIRLPAI